MTPSPFDSSSLDGVVVRAVACILEVAAAAAARFGRFLLFAATSSSVVSSVSCSFGHN